MSVFGYLSLSLYPSPIAFRSPWSCAGYLGDCHYGLKDFKKSGSGSIRKTMGYIKLWLGLTEDVENKPYLVVSETKNELSNEMRLKI